MTVVLPGNFSFYKIYKKSDLFIENLSVKENKTKKKISSGNFSFCFQGSRLDLDMRLVLEERIKCGKNLGQNY